MFKEFRTMSIKNSKKKSHRKSIANIETTNGKVLVINGIPDCLKVYSVKKFGMIQDLNDKLASIINDKNTNLIVFLFNASRERNKTFLSKIFNESILNNRESVKVMKMNEITENNIKKTIQNIIQDNGIKIQFGRIDEIVRNCNKDLLNAIQTLQFYAAGNSGVESNATQINNFQRQKRK